MAFDIVKSREFFQLLYEDEQFCSSVGRVMLAASVLEAKLRDYLGQKGLMKVNSRETLGQLVSSMKEKGFLSEKIDYHFEDLVLKRNYLAHSIYDLFYERIEETILQRTELVAEDTDYFAQRAHQTAEELLFFAGIVEKSEGGLIG